MAFVMPSKYSEDQLPIPNNSSVKIRKVPSKTVAVLAFSGTTKELLCPIVLVSCPCISFSKITILPVHGFISFRLMF